MRRVSEVRNELTIDTEPPSTEDEMYGDTEVIRALARRLDQQADEIREHAQQLLRAAHRVLWEGRAAHAMQERMRDRAAALDHTATEHEVAAGLLRRHAQLVEERKALIAEIAAKVASAVDGAKSRLSAIAGGLVDAVRDPFDERLARLSWPPGGHLDWLGVPDEFLRATR
jgi:ABC-type phosphate transport system auxiliary subunit